MDFGLVDERDQERFHFHKGDLRGKAEPDECVRICVGEFGYVDFFVLGLRGVSMYVREAEKRKV